MLNAQIERLGHVVAEHLGRHRDADIYTSLPGLGVILGARILGEFGDDPHRYADAKGRKAYAGTAPITRASGTRRVVLARYARNRRLGDAVQQWAFFSMRGSAGARVYYQVLRKRGVGHQSRSSSARQPLNRDTPRLLVPTPALPHLLRREHRLAAAPQHSRLTEPERATPCRSILGSALRPVLPRPSPLVVPPSGSAGPAGRPSGAAQRR